MSEVVVSAGPAAPESLIRLSAGIELAGDLIADIGQSLEAVR